MGSRHFSLSNKVCNQAWALGTPPSLYIVLSMINVVPVSICNFTMFWDQFFFPQASASTLLVASVSWPNCAVRTVLLRTAQLGE